MQVAFLEAQVGFIIAVLIFLLFAVLWKKSSIKEAAKHLVGIQFLKELLFPTLLSGVVFSIALIWAYIGWELCRVV
ncbi:MAG TPA: hypothetical protein VKN76_15230 [Kiloniellaceae bacterium]|nr:hypothetical protein [Kiloniellaceae bacterium]